MPTNDSTTEVRTHTPRRWTGDGGPAFPTDHSTNSEYTSIEGGMSLRDYFAAHALSGIIASLRETGVSVGGVVFAEEATTAYAFADAMLKERSKA